MLRFKMILLFEDIEVFYVKLYQTFIQDNQFFLSRDTGFDCILLDNILIKGPFKAILLAFRGKIGLIDINSLI